MFFPPKVRTSASEESLSPLAFYIRGVHKRRPQSGGGEGVCLVRTFCGQRRFFRCGRPHYLVQKNFGFFEIYDVSARTRRDRANADIFRTREKGVSFSRFCADVFYGRPL